MQLLRVNNFCILSPFNSKCF